MRGIYSARNPSARRLRQRLTDGWSIASLRTPPNTVGNANVAPRDSFVRFALLLVASVRTHKPSYQRVISNT